MLFFYIIPVMLFLCHILFVSDLFQLLSLFSLRLLLNSQNMLLTFLTVPHQMLQGSLLQGYLHWHRVNCNGCNRDTAWHLYDGIQRVYTAQIRSLHRDTDYREWKDSCTHSWKVSCFSSTCNDHFKTFFPLQPLPT